MTRVGGIGAGAPAARRPARAGTGFALPGGTPAREATAMPGAEGIGALLGLQEQVAPLQVEPAAERAARRGREALVELQGLQLDLLRGSADPGRLARLAALAVSTDVADPVLRRTLDEIALRARIELARHRAASASGV